MQTQKMIFIDKNSSVDKESLRAYALKSLKESRIEVQKCLSNPLWDQLSNVVGSQKDKIKFTRHRKVEAQLQSLPVFIDKYIQTALDSSERFELFILIKAAELKDQSEKHNYFWALQIRHDQIIALVRVVEKVSKLLSFWTKSKISTILEDEEFTKLADLSIEDQVYLEAEKVYKERNKIADR